MRASTHSLPEQEFRNALRPVFGDGERRPACTRQRKGNNARHRGSAVSSLTDGENKPGLDKPL
jgi:hypothetical protein